MVVWVVTVLMCAHGHAVCSRRIDDTGFYFFKRAACESVLGTLPAAQHPQCTRTTRRKMKALGYSPIGVKSE